MQKTNVDFDSNIQMIESRVNYSLSVLNTTVQKNSNQIQLNDKTANDKISNLNKSLLLKLVQNRGYTLFVFKSVSCCLIVCPC